MIEVTKRFLKQEGLLNSTFETLEGGIKKKDGYFLFYIV